jgi:hypothetical protein
MSIADKLKALPFYAELMEKTFPVPDLCNLVAQLHLNKALLKQVIYKQWHTKKRIKKTSLNYQDKFQLYFSNDGNYFIENVSNNSSDTINIWDASNYKPIHSLQHIFHAFFSPTNDYLCVQYMDATKTIVYPMPLPDCFKKQQEFALLMPRTFEYRDITIAASHDGTILLIRERNGSQSSYTLYHLDIPNRSYSTQQLPNIPHNASLVIIHPGNKHLVYRTNNYDRAENIIALYDIDNPTSTQEIKMIFPYLDNGIAINNTGDLLMLDNHALYQFQETPICVKKFEVASKNILFIPQKKLLLYHEASDNYLITDEEGQEFAKIKVPSTTNQIITNDSNTHIAATFITQPWSKELPQVWLFNVSEHTKSIPITKIIFPRHSTVFNAEFTKDQLIVLQSNTTQLRDMEGDKVLDLGRCKKFAINPKTNAIITIHNNNYQISSDHGTYTAVCPTKMHLHTINSAEAQKMINTITQSLTLSQALLFNAHGKRKKIKELYPNLPSGRALQSLPKQYLTKSFTLKDKPYNSTSALKLLTQ